MCWNASISLNTFLFSSFVLLLIMYNNAFTKYKIHELNNIWIYLFFASFIFMQLIEAFIWRNIDNKFYNQYFSILGTCLLISQPIFSIMILSKISLRNKLLLLYLLLAIPYSLYKFFTKKIYSTVSKSGHLVWNFFESPPIITVFWFFFFLFSLIYERKWFGILFCIISLLLAYYNYKNDKSMWSLWCWMVNFVMIYYAIYLLIFLPFFEKGNIC